MRKKSHLSLASYILNSQGMEVLCKYKIAFYWGNILPDCVPSFFTRKHCIEDTFHIMEKELTLLIEDYDYNKGITGYFCKHLGILLHYIADYFTYPHNTFFTGSMVEHCLYEKEMKLFLRSYIKSNVQNMVTKKIKPLPDSNGVAYISSLVKEAHKQYSKSKHSVKNDCEFILSICHQVVDFILATGKRECLSMHQAIIC